MIEVFLPELLRNSLQDESLLARDCGVFAHNDRWTDRAESVHGPLHKPSDGGLISVPDLTDTMRASPSAFHVCFATSLP